MSYDRWDRVRQGTALCLGTYWISRLCIKFRGHLDLKVLFFFFFVTLYLPASLSNLTAIVSAWPVSFELILKEN